MNFFWPGFALGAWLGALIGFWIAALVQAGK